jgi:hypothetical protein
MYTRQNKDQKLVEFGYTGRDSDNSNAELLSGNDNTSHAEASSDSTYCERD